MQLQAEQVALIRRSFAQIEPIAPLAAGLFYGQLFALAPEIRPLFRYEPGSPGMAQQGSKLMQMLGVAVAHLDRLDEVTPALEALARRHVAYGVEPAHYDLVGAALLWTLAQGLGDDYTPQVAAAWAALYDTLAAVMLRAAHVHTDQLAAERAMRF
ncbi:hemin receptor [Candidatus Gracilibacteria bacterium]|nr:hemin receptor [Candidatus Gracilibacteria bacterium]